MQFSVTNPSSIANANSQLRQRYAILRNSEGHSIRNRLRAFSASAFLVAVPVFIQAPLVRMAPLMSLLLTGLWLGLGYRWLQIPHRRLWGDLLVGFSWTWLAGSVYWGWFRTQPYIHLPIEALALPIVLGLMAVYSSGQGGLSVGHRKGLSRFAGPLFTGPPFAGSLLPDPTVKNPNSTFQIGNYFYLGSLLGTAITDLYFYCTGLIPYWKALMINPPEQAGEILHAALLRMGTYEGVGYAIVLLALLVLLGLVPMRFVRVEWWAFSGAILSTILVDSLFFVAALLA